MTESIYTIRSFRDCIRQGFSGLVSSPWKMTKALGPCALLQSLLLIIYISVNLRLNVFVLLNGTFSAADIATLLTTYLFACIGIQVFTTKVFLYLRKEHTEIDGKPHKWKYYLRSLPYTIWGYILMCPLFSITGALLENIPALGATWKIALACIAVLIVLCLVLYIISALTYCLFSDMMEDKASNFKQDFKVGMHNANKIFGMQMMSNFIVFVLTFLAAIPCYIAQRAYLSSIEANVNFGDDVLIPTSGYVLMFIVSALSLTFCSIIASRTTASQLYQFGSIRETTNNKEVVQGV